MKNNQFIINICKLTLKKIGYFKPEYENLDNRDIWFKSTKHFLKHFLKECIFKTLSLQS